MICIGIDPGLTGAGAAVDHNGLVGVFDLPTMEIPGVGPEALVKNKIDGHALCTQLLRLCPLGSGKPLVLIESVRAMGGKDNSIQTQASLLRSLGAIETVAECLGWKPQYVAPQKWKKFFGLIDPALKDSERKRESLARARALYPNTKDDVLRLAKSHNRAEALLLAHWGVRTLS